jgi:hypothetical protein
MKRCSKCGQIKQETEFVKSKKSKDGLASYCKECHNRWARAWRSKNREKVNSSAVNRYNELKVFIDSFKTPCVKCGESRLYVIQFHHINPTDKSFSIAHETYGRETTEAEIKKCVCLCSNCHDEFHYFYGVKPEKPVESLTEYLGRSPYEI